jgi:hypothetical protein
MPEIGDIPEEVFRTAAIAVDPVDPDGTQHNQSFRQAVAAGWIQGRASIPDDGEPRRSSAIEAWIKRRRDWFERNESAWIALDGLLADYRYAADTGKPLGTGKVDGEGGTPAPDHDSVYLDIRDGLLTMTQTTGRTLSVMVNGAYIAVPDRTRSTINYGVRSSIEYGSREGAGDA